MTTTSTKQAPNGLDRLEPDMGAFVAIAGLALLLVSALTYSVSYHRGLISGATEATIANPEALDWVDHPDAQWQDQIAWPLTAHAALLCGRDDQGLPRTVVSKVHDGVILDELWIDAPGMQAEAIGFCEAALQRRDDRA